MKAKLLAMAVISAFALSACVFEDDDDNIPKVNNQTNPTQNQGDNGQGQGQSDNGNDDSSTTQQKATYSYTMNSIGEPTSIATTPKYAKGNDGVNFDEIQINGKTFTLPENQGYSGPVGEGIPVPFAPDRRYHAENAAEGWEYSIAPTQGTNGTAYARYGWYRGENPAEVGFFYQGNPTPVSDMPTTGTNVTYNGYAMAVDMPQNAQAIKNGKEAQAYYYGQSTFSVDFANKSMTGTLNDWQGKSGFTAKNEVKIVVDKGNIKGNTFKGTANGTGTAEGKFYGPKAQNLAGAFNDKTQNLQGVFGANKQ